MTYPLFFLLTFICGLGLGTASAHLRLPLYFPIGAIVLVYLLAVIPVR